MARIRNNDRDWNDDQKRVTNRMTTKTNTRTTVTTKTLTRNTVTTKTRTRNYCNKQNETNDTIQWRASLSVFLLLGFLSETF